MSEIKDVFRKEAEERKKRFSKDIKRKINEKQAETDIGMRYREKPHRFEVKDQKVIIRLRKWQEEMLYSDFRDSELLILMTAGWIDKRRAEMIIPPKERKESGDISAEERIDSGYPLDK